MKNIIFDIGNVLLKFDSVGYLKNTFKNEEVEKVLMKEIFQSKEWAELDKGSITNHEAERLFVLRNPEYKKEISLCMNHWSDMLIPIKENVDMLLELKNKGYNLYLLSNFHDEAFNKVKNKYDFFKCFNGGIISYQVHLLKPEEPIYKELLEKYNLAPEESVFIDDTLNNVNTARGLNIHGIHFTGEENIWGQFWTFYHFMNFI